MRDDSQPAAQPEVSQSTGHSILEAVGPQTGTATHRQTRRGFLAATASAAAVALAGCLSRGNGADPGDQAPGQPLPVPSKGDPDANVTVKVYEDYMCGGCLYYHSNVRPDVESEYVEPGAVHYEFHDYPLPVDKDLSWAAASAARAVQDIAGEDAFWTYQDRLFTEQSDLDQDKLVSLAEGLVNDSSDIREAVEEQAYHETVDHYRSQGSDYGVERTPEIVIDGELIGWDEIAFEPIQSTLDGKL